MGVAISVILKLYTFFLRNQVLGNIKITKNSLYYSYFVYIYFSYEYIFKIVKQ